MERYLQSRLAFGILAAPCAWIVQGLSGWFLGSRVCSDTSISLARIGGGAIGAFALAIAIAGVLTSLSNWSRRVSNGPGFDDGSDFVALAGVFISGTFAVGIFWAWLSVWFLNSCGNMR